MIMKTIIAVIIVVFIAAIVVAVLGALLVFHDYEHTKTKCGNCANRDEGMHYCWSRGFDVGTETKGCSLFVNKHKV